ncbi:MAG: cation-translocating P-type ATPase [Lachnospiraceae bacterium]|nr:cation-translocating P-type ATPase [Lachnospiraceae bacterium]
MNGRKKKQRDKHTEEVRIEHTGNLTERRETTRYNADINTGLSSAQVKEYVQNGWENTAVEPPSKTVSEIIKNNTFTYFNLIFTIIAILLIIVGSFRDLTFLPIIILNTVIGIVQEIRAKNTLEKLSVLNAPKAHVMRDGKQLELPAEKLVLDDIVIFQAGNQICADAVVLNGEVSVNESLLTGESDELIKKQGDHLMSGSFIVSGSCHARLDKVGADSYISKLTLEAKAMKEGEQSEMIRSLNKLVKAVGIIIIPIGLLLFSQQFFFNHDTLRNSVTSMVAAVIGMIPEGLYLLASVALVVSVMRLASKKVLVHDMKCIETLARVDVLCVDKTGTITENIMSVNQVIETDNYDADTMDPLKVLISDFAAAMASDNITMEAMKKFFDTPGSRVPISITSFSSAFKYSSATFSDGAYVLGAPEFVLRSDYEAYHEEIEVYGEQGYRVLVFGSYAGIPDGKELTASVVPLGLVLLANPIRKEAPETFRYFAEQGVAVKVISGDNPVTVSEVAKQANIANADRFIDASKLKTEEDIANAVKTYTVFGRVTPNQKRQFVQALKAAGKTVAMTGDGVNDVLALKDADCSVAMASGSDAAAQAAQLVLLESNFACMPSVVEEGRRVVNNIQRSASLFLVKNIFSFLMSLISVLFMITYPLEPSQVSLISMFTIGIPAFFLALQPNKNIIQGHFLTNVLLKALPAGLTDVIVVGALVLFGKVFSVSSIDISTACTMLIAIVGFMILFKICQPFDKIRLAIWICAVIGLLFCSFFLRNLFAISGMSTKCIMLFVLFSIATEPILRYGTKLVSFLRNNYVKLRTWRRTKKAARHAE